VLFRLHKFQDSIRHLSKSLELNIGNADAHRILGLDLTIIGKDALARVEFEQAVRWDPDSAENHYWLGRHYMDKQVFPLAKQELEAAIALDPRYMKAYDNLGLTMEALGDNDAAIKSYLRATKLVEEQKLDSEWPYLDLARLYNRLNDSKQAFKYATKAIERNPRADQAYFELAKVYRYWGQWDQAVEALQKSIEINPRSADYYYVLSYLYRKLGKLKESNEALQSFMRLHKAPPVLFGGPRGPMGSSRTRPEP
jgi:tetratricopeptide (TPR) repeat protein